MAILTDLAEYLEEETAMTVHEAVLVMSKEDEIPRLRLFNDDVNVHGLFRAPAGLFMCDMTNEGKDPFFSEITQGNVVDDELTRLDPQQEFLIEPNWPTRKVLIDGRYYALPRNFALPFQNMIQQAQQKKKRRK